MGPEEHPPAHTFSPPCHISSKEKVKPHETPRTPLIVKSSIMLPGTNRRGWVYFTALPALAPIFNLFFNEQRVKSLAQTLRAHSQLAVHVEHSLHQRWAPGTAGDPSGKRSHTHRNGLTERAGCPGSLSRGTGLIRWIGSGGLGEGSCRSWGRMGGGPFAVAAADPSCRALCERVHSQHL